MKKCLMIALVSLSFTAIAEDDVIDCNNAMNTLEINQCASIELDSAQAKIEKYLKISFEHNSYDPESVSAIKVEPVVGI